MSVLWVLLLWLLLWNRWCNVQCVPVRSLYTKNVVVLPMSPEKGDKYYGMSPPKLRIWSSVWQSWEVVPYFRRKMTHGDSTIMRIDASHQSESAVLRMASMRSAEPPPLSLATKSLFTSPFPISSSVPPEGITRKPERHQCQNGCLINGFLL